jgi:F-type H+-transporting ATPase subunit c
MDLAILGLGLGMGLLVTGAAYGIGKLAAAAMDGTARQPEAGAAIRTTAIILAALIEGFTFLAIIFIFLLGNGAIAKEEAKSVPPNQPVHTNPVK